MTVDLIVNPASGPVVGRLPRHERVHAVSQQLRTLGATTIRSTETLGRGDAADAARRALDAGSDRVVAWGGDGTLNEVATTLLDTGMRLGVIPGGSGNGLARGLGLPLDMRRAVQVAMQGQPRDIDTGLAFFDHMLDQVAAHGGFSLTIACKGDLEIDAHHSLEDTAIAFGQALSKALDGRRGIGRFGFSLPMDEAEAHVLIDLSGRPFSRFEGAFDASHIGAYPTQMTGHIFRSFADSLGAAIHVRVEGDNDHHKTEACFKAFGRALRQAIAREGGSEAVPSTKGVL